MSSYRPTRKWIAAAVTGVASIVASVIVTGVYGEVERGMTATLLVALASSFLTTNSDGPGGVPV